ncbi:MAG: dTMP kinase [Thermocrispum sp.]
MGELVVIEGLDGAGKNTLATALTGQLHAVGATVHAVAFPRYGVDVHADLIRDGLHGRLGDLTASVYGFQLLYALDRRAAAAELRAALGQYDVVLVDRYVASNAAYGAARLHERADGDFVAWVRSIEVERFGVPAPDAQILLRVPATVAGERSRGRAQADADRGRDQWESDAELQDRVAQVYDELAAAAWLSPWQVVDGSHEVDVAKLTTGLGFGGSTANDTRSGPMDTVRGRNAGDTAGSSGAEHTESANIRS